MAIAILQDRFAASDYDVFSSRVSEQLLQLDEVLRRPGFGVGPITIGAELEMPLIGSDGRPRALNRELLARVNDPRATVEIAKFNIECNLTACDAAGRPFSAMQHEMEEMLGRVAVAGEALDVRAMPVGILPSITADDIGPNSLTDAPRYRALEAAVQRLRDGPANIRINGQEPIALVHDGVTFEGANTSFQVHLRVAPDRYADTYNAAQLATSVALAVSTNSPIFLDHLLWEETRIAVFKQSVEARTEEELGWHRPARVAFGHGWVRKGAFELFAESVRFHEPIFPVCDSEPDTQDPPRLSELRLHQGTVWRWNRAVYDPADGGHVRIEFRALPSGPTPLDMAANAAFLLGVTMGLRDEVERVLEGCPFLMADRSFYRAARDGMDAVLLWPGREGLSPRERKVTELVRLLLPVADAGLEALGVVSDERHRYLKVIEGRLDAGITGARWQRRSLQALRRRVGRADAPAQLALAYDARARTGAPVHLWDPV